MFVTTASIITPTYNRARTLPRVYESLKAQTLQNFNWIIIDDGSTDATKDVVETFIRESKIPITYKYKPNGGVHTARNCGIREATGDILFLIDSDDELTPTAVERAVMHWNALDNPEDYYEVQGRCIYADNNLLVGAPYPDNINDIPRKKQARLLRRKFAQECIGAQSTAILKMHPFPEPANVKFVPENFLWTKLHAMYKSYYTNEIFRVYHTGGTDRLTSRGPGYEVLYPAVLYYTYLLNDIFPVDNSYYTLSNRLNTLLRLGYAIVRTGMHRRQIARELKKRIDRILLLTLYIPLLILGKTLGTAGIAAKQSN